MPRPPKMPVNPSASSRARARAARQIWGSSIIRVYFRDHGSPFSCILRRRAAGRLRLRRARARAISEAIRTAKKKKKRGVPKCSALCPHPPALHPDRPFLSRCIGQGTPKHARSNCGATGVVAPSARAGGPTLGSSGSEIGLSSQGLLRGARLISSAAQNLRRARRPGGAPSKCIAPARSVRFHGGTKRVANESCGFWFVLCAR